MRSCLTKFAASFKRKRNKQNTWIITFSGDEGKREPKFFDKGLHVFLLFNSEEKPFRHIFVIPFEHIFLILWTEGQRLDCASVVSVPVSVLSPERCALTTHWLKNVYIGWAVGKVSARPVRNRIRAPLLDSGFECQNWHISTRLVELTSIVWDVTAGAWAAGKNPP